MATNLPATAGARFCMLMLASCGLGIEREHEHMAEVGVTQKVTEVRRGRGGVLPATACHKSL